MSVRHSDLFTKMETTCGRLLLELQEIWIEVGETDETKESMLLEIEQQCLDLYRTKVDHAYQCRAQLRQAIADSESELAKIYSTLGNHPVHNIQPDQKAANLKEELNAVICCLEDMRKKKKEREKQFTDILEHINSISTELYSSPGEAFRLQRADPDDLSLKSLDALHVQLDALQKEKSDRLKKIMDYLNSLSSLCLVLGIDFKDNIREIHPTLDDYKGTRIIDNGTIQKLSATVENLKEVKIQRLGKLQDFAVTLLELWNLMDTPTEEQHRFQDITSKIAASELEITEPNCLSIDAISFAEAEVLRLDNLKSSKMKELILRRKSELEEICRKSHMVIDVWGAAQYSVEAIDSGAIDPGHLLDQIDLQISKAKEEAFSRKEILERVDKWKTAREEESWLEEYNRDDNRYNAGRGAHLILKRAEKARAMVNKLPSMMEILTQKTRAWQTERGTEFLYDGVQLLSMLEQYIILRQEKELERQRMKDQKKLQGQLLAEQEALFGSKASPSKSVKRGPRYSIGGSTANKRYSLAGSIMQKSKPERYNIHSHPINKITGSRQGPGKTNTIVAGHLPKKQGNTRNLGQSSTRKPLSPVSPLAPQNTNHKNSQEQRIIITLASQLSQTPPLKSPTRTPKSSTPSKTKSADKMHSPVPSTPLSFFVPMQTITTPGTPCSLPYQNKSDEFVEYSFEELRAGFLLHQRIK
ncbi:hypothetical protein V2J09_015238 [Rumex salicifolius]